MDKDSVLKKIEALINIANNSSAYKGEKDSATDLINKLKAKYGITDDMIESLNDEKRTSHQFRYQGKEGRKILYHVAYKIIGNIDDLVVYTMKRKRQVMMLLIECTDAEAIQIQFLYDFYYDLYHKELDLFMTAFINKHNLFGISNGQSGGPDYSDEDIDRIKGIMKNMRDDSPLLAISSGDDN